MSLPDEHCSVCGSTEKQRYEGQHPFPRKGNMLVPETPKSSLREIENWFRNSHAACAVAGAR